MRGVSKKRRRRSPPNKMKMGDIMDGESFFNVFTHDTNRRSPPFTISLLHLDARYYESYLVGVFDRAALFLSFHNQPRCVYLVCLSVLPCRHF